jgi:hypothetical protein
MDGSRVFATIIQWNLFLIVNQILFNENNFTRSFFEVRYGHATPRRPQWASGRVGLKFLAVEAASIL